MGKIQEWNTENRMKKSERYHYHYLVNIDQECATNELIEEATGLIRDFEANKDIDAKEVLPRKGYGILVLLGAILFVLPLCWVAEMLATRVFGFANCSAPYWCTYVGTILVLGSLWAILWLRVMEAIKNAIMSHRIQKLNIWTKAARKAIATDYLDDIFNLDDFVEVKND